MKQIRGAQKERRWFWLRFVITAAVLVVPLLLSSTGPASVLELSSVARVSASAAGADYWSAADDSGAACGYQPLAAMAASLAQQAALSNAQAVLSNSQAGLSNTQAALSNTQGGDLAAVRCILDPYPTFSAIAVDPESNQVMIGDGHHKSLLIYDRTKGGKSGRAGRHSSDVTEPLRQIIGPATQLGFISGVAVDPISREVFAVNNDVEDNMAVFSYDAAGNLKPKRALGVPHGAWGISLSRSRDEMALSAHEEYNAVVVYRRDAKGGEAPLRSMRGPHTGLADPHGIYLDDVNNELVVANWGNWNVLTKTFYSGNYFASGSQPAGSGPPTGGRFEPPSLTVYPITAEGDAKPVRIIQGPRTRLNWPSGIDLDSAANEIAVANNGDNSVLVFRRTDSGDAEPLRAIRGSRTGIDRPLAVAIDRKNNELWVANFGEHTAVVFDRMAQGNATPKRIIRNAPEGTPTAGFGNVISLAYDSKRDELLVPN